MNQNITTVFFQVTSAITRQYCALKKMLHWHNENFKNTKKVCPIFIEFYLLLQYYHWIAKHFIIVNMVNIM